MTLDGPTEVRIGELHTWIISAPDLEPGVDVHMGWGGAFGPGRCPFRRRVGGWLCLEVADPLRHFDHTLSEPDPLVPGGGRAVFELEVPPTFRDQIHFQGLSVDGADSATSTVLTVNILRDPVPMPESCDLVDSDLDGDLVDDFDDTDLDGIPDCVDDDDDGDGVDDPADCEPLDPSVFPGAMEVYDDGIDQDCDGNDSVTCWADLDGDGSGGPCPELEGEGHSGDTGLGDCVVIGTDGDCDDPGESLDGDDCDDTDPGVNPGAVEVCNGVDDNCDGGVDEGLTLTVYVDGDGDGFGAGAPQEACSVTPGLSASSDDCADSDPARWPGATEVCNTLDDDCDTSVDEGVQTTYYRDVDGDTWGINTTLQACSEPSGYTFRNGDCADSNPARNPGAAEVCNAIDDDCDTAVDEGVKTTYWRDADSDGYGNAAVSVEACSLPSGYVTNDDDCADATRIIRPGVEMKRLRRLFHPGQHDHLVLFDDNPNIPNLTSSGWNLEGAVGWVVWRVDGSTTMPADIAALTNPVQRWFSTANEDHAISKSTTTRPPYADASYAKETVFGYVPRSSVFGSQPLRQFYNVGLSDHNTVTDPVEITALQNSGWVETQQTGHSYTTDRSCP